MTIPIAPPNIHPTQAVQPRTPLFMALFLKAYEDSQNLEIQRERLRQQREQWEVQRKLVGEQTEAVKLENDKRKRDFKAAEDDLLAQSEALRLYTGSIPHGGNMSAWSVAIGTIKDPRIREHYLNYALQGLKLEQAQTATTSGQLGLEQQQRGIEQDRQIRGLLEGFNNKQWTQESVGNVVRKAFTIGGPVKAKQVGDALAISQPGYQIDVGPNGEVTWLPKVPTPGVSAAPNRPTEQMVNNSLYGSRILEANGILTEMEGKHPGIGQRVDAKLRAVRTVEQYPAVGRALATQLFAKVLKTMTPEERKYTFARIDLGNAFLRRASGAQINMEELDRETAPFVPVESEDEMGVSDKQMRRLQQGVNIAQSAGLAFDYNKLTPRARSYITGSIVPKPPPRSNNPFAAPQ